MEQPTNEILIDYLDSLLDPEESSRIDSILQKDMVTAGEMQYLKLAIETVCLNAIREKVSAVRNSQEPVQDSHHKMEKGIVRIMYKTSLRVAAIFILLIGSATLYKYISVTNQSIYEKRFTGFELTNTRGAESRDGEAEAYRNKNWNEVIAIYNAESSKSNKSRFLAAMAEMQLNHFPQAEALFESILSIRSGDNSFQEEAEYYLSLAYLMDHKENKSIQLLNKIKADTSHTYYPMASKISAIDLKIIELKNN
jgi:hypothetical protein